jgi:hypothetical protein
MIGHGSGNVIKGEDNIILGTEAMYLGSTANARNSNVAVGPSAMRSFREGSNNIAIGNNAGSGTVSLGSLLKVNNSILIGRNTKVDAEDGTNEVVIGDSAYGAGSNTVVLGNDSVERTLLKGSIYSHIASQYINLYDFHTNAQVFEFIGFNNDYNGYQARETYFLRRFTTSDTAQLLSIQGATPSATNTILIEEGAAYSFDVTVIGREIEGSGNTYTVNFKGFVINDGTVSGADQNMWEDGNLVGTAVVKILYNDTDSRLDIEVSGVAADVEWSAAAVLLKNHAPVTPP